MPTAPLLLCALALHLPAQDDWPAWRGPGGRAIAEGSPPVELDREENLAWRAEVPGRGLSCPVVVGEHVYLTSALGTGRTRAADSQGQGAGRGRGRSAPLEEQELWVLAYARSSGELAWRAKAATAMPHQGTHRDGSYATPTIAADAERVIASFGSFGVYAYDHAGQPLWQTDLGELSITMGFGEGSSPALHGDTLVLNWDHDGDSFVVALDAASGEERWRTERSSGTSWTSPLIVEHGERVQVIVGTRRASGYDLDSGAELWAWGQAPARGGGVITSTVVADGRVFVATGARRGALHAFDLAALSDGEPQNDAELLWTHSGDTPHVPSPIAYGGLLYMLKSNSGILTAFDAATGEVVYGPLRMEGLQSAYASPVAASGRLYFAGRDGAVEVVAAGREYVSLHTSRFEDSFDASPAIAGDALYLRGRSHLYCLRAPE